MCNVFAICLRSSALTHIYWVKYTLRCLSFVGKYYRYSGNIASGGQSVFYINTPKPAVVCQYCKQCQERHMQDVNQNSFLLLALVAGH